MNAREYFSQIVLPTYEDFERDPTSVRFALLTAIALFHTLDYVNRDSGGMKGNLGALQQHVCKRCFPFRLIKDLANGVKHVEIRGPSGFRPDEIKVYSEDDVVHTEALDAGIEREYRSKTPMLWVERGGHKHFVHTDLFVVTLHLATEFSLGHVAHLRPPLQLVYRDRE